MMASGFWLWQQRSCRRKQACSKEDERELVLKGYVAFLDPPKDTAGSAIEALHKQGVAVKILTGDNDLISRKVCRDVGLPADPMLLGGDVEKMSDPQLARRREKTTLFARLSPAHKQRSHPRPPGQRTCRRIHGRRNQ